MASEDGDFCSFTKAVEHLGDRWSLLIIRELAIHGRLGFNALAEVLPGISRSVLAARLRKLQALGLVARVRSGRNGHAPYRLAPAGEQLLPTLMSLRSWAERWIPEDPAMVEHDPDIVALWLARRVDAARSPAREAVIGLIPAGSDEARAWLVVERGVPASLCIEDPGLAASRYVYVESDLETFHAIARGASGWTEMIARGAVRVYGEPELVRAMPNWFAAPDSVPERQPLRSLVEA